MAPMGVLSYGPDTCSDHISSCHHACTFQLPKTDSLCSEPAELLSTTKSSGSVICKTIQLLLKPDLAHPHSEVGLHSTQCTE